MPLKENSNVYHDSRASGNRWKRQGPKRLVHLREANVSYDHPFNAPLEHALNIDFVNEAQGPGARVAVEISAEAARSLAQTILVVLDRAEAGGHLE